ncbi:S24 family peptidase [Sphingomonas faeni]|uniref:S24 family peptidase n=1 Tax=Sphingomonas faeni TaxID=185950 RepID=UPI00335712FC
MPNAALDLKALRNRTVPKIASRTVADELGIPQSTYASMEDPAKNKKPFLSLQIAKQLAPIFAARGVSEADTLRLAGVTGELTEQFRTSKVEPPLNVDDDEWVAVTGSVQAGIWREQSDWSSAERYDVKFGPSVRPGADRFGLRMEGLSMNKTILPGSDLECYRIGRGGINAVPGTLVIVARNAHDLVELTCKRLDMVDDEWVLRCESTEPEFQDLIPIGKPDEGMFTDEEIRVVGIVASAKQDLAPPGFGTRRYRHV